MPLPPCCFEDVVVWFFAKPPGQSVVKERGTAWAQAQADGAAGAVLLDEVRAARGEEAWAFHRLDAAASGLAGIARTKLAADFLSGQFQSKRAMGVFEALVVVATPEETAGGGVPAWRDESGAVPEEGVIAWPLGPEEEQPEKWRVFKRRGGRPAETRVTVVERFGRFAWVRCWPESGRAGQARAHLAAVGLPVLGDKIYGLAGVTLRLSDLKRGYKGKDVEKPLVGHLALHLAELTLLHPKTREAWTVSAPLPETVQIALKYLRRFAPGAPR